MIYDRTYNDIVRAKKIFAGKVQKFLPLTDDEQAVMDKAYFNLKAINRITAKIQEIWDKIEEMGEERVTNKYVKEWARDEIFTIYALHGLFLNTQFAIKAMGSFGIDVTDLLEEWTSLNHIGGNYSYTWLNGFEHLLQMVWEKTLDLSDVWAYQVDDTLYIIGAYSAAKEGKVLTIE